MGLAVLCDGALETVIEAHRKRLFNERWGSVGLDGHSMGKHIQLHSKRGGGRGDRPASSHAWPPKPMSTILELETQAVTGATTPPHFPK